MPLTPEQLEQKAERQKYYDANLVHSANILAMFDCHTNGGRKYKTHEEFLVWRKIYKRAHAILWSRKNKPWRARDAKRRAGIRPGQGRPASPAIHRFYCHVAKVERKRCKWCRKWTPKGERVVDHIIPINRGGKHIRTNLCCACWSCNSQKSDMMPEDFMRKLASSL